MTSFLAAQGIDYERWTPSHPVAATAPAAEVLAAYGAEIDRLKARGGYVTADVIDVRPDTPGLDAMLAKFSREHWHDEDEVRFILEGTGVFHIHPRRAPVFAIEVGRRPHPRAPRHLALVRPVRRPAHPRHPPVPGRLRLDAAVHRERGRRGFEPVCLGPEPPRRARVSGAAPLVLLDIEGTTTPIDFVSRVLFPYAREPDRGLARTHAAESDDDRRRRGLRAEHDRDVAAGRDPPAVDGRPRAPPATRAGSWTRTGRSRP